MMIQTNNPLYIYLLVELVLTKVVLITRLFMHLTICINTAKQDNAMSCPSHD
jgi:N-dimethylarginine dimethylaminohydrolase